MRYLASWLLAAGLGCIAACSRETAPQAGIAESGAGKAASAAQSDGLHDRATTPVNRGMPAQPSFAKADQRSPATGPSAPRLAPIESSFVRNGALNGGIEKQLAAEDFDKLMSSFEREQSSNMASAQTTQAYASQVEKTLAAVPGSAAMQRFACGETVCVGSARSARGEDWFNSWYENFAKNSDLPIRSMIREDVPVSGGGIDHRIVFTTQGEGGIYMPPGSAKPKLPASQS